MKQQQFRVDKVVVYDRMRENLQLQPQSSLQDIIDRNINETLARSLFTSVTALLAMLLKSIWHARPALQPAIKQRTAEPLEL